ncbi:MAG: MFS transporter, partial [Burkholderiales bacterium]
MRRLLLLVGGIVFVDTMFFAALTPLLPDYADEFNLSKAGAGVLSAAYPAGALVGGIPGGLATARFGARPTAITGLLLIAVSTFVFANADSIWLLDLSRFVQGLGSAAAWTAGLTWLVGETPSERRGQTIGTAMAAAIVGALFGPVLGGAAAVVGEPAAFGTAGLAAVGLAAWAFVTHAPPPTQPQPLGVLLRGLRSERIALGIWFVALPALLFGTLSVLA